VIANNMTFVPSPSFLPRLSFSTVSASIFRSFLLFLSPFHSSSSSLVHSLSVSLVPSPSDLAGRCALRLHRASDDIIEELNFNKNRFGRQKPTD